MKKTLLMILILLFVIFLILLFFFKSPSKKTKIHDQPKVVPNISSIQSSGWFKLKSLTDITVGLNDYIVINLLADSVNQSVVGYDLVLTYDADKLIIKEVKNLLKDFDIYKKQSIGKLMISGVLKPTVKTKNPFQNTSLLRLEFQTVATGRANLKIEWQKDSLKDSNLISDQSKDILGPTQPLMINIGKKITLIKNQPLLVEEGLKIELLDLTPPDSHCFDCLSSAKISLSKDNQKKEFTFKEGGIAGTIIKEFYQFNYGFYLDKINNNGIEVIIFKK